MSDDNLDVIFSGEHPLRNGGKVQYYNVGPWGLEVCFDENGVVQASHDASVEDAEQSVKVWRTWAAFLARKGWEANNE
jgi:hypothetical protein